MEHLENGRTRERSLIDRLTEESAHATVVRVGVDVGKQGDPSAIVTTEEETRDGIAHYLVRHIQRLPLGTSYVDVAARVAEIMANLRRVRDKRRREGGYGFRIELIVDGTGVGMPVIDLIRERKLKPIVAIFTGTEKLTVHPDDALSVGKAWMVSRLQTQLQAERLHLPDTPEAKALVAELHDYQINVNEIGHTSFNAQSGSHDDLVIALGLSIGTGQRRRHGTYWVTPRAVKSRW